MKYLNEILIEWDNSDIEDSGIINPEEVKNHLDIPYLPLPSRDDTLNVEDFYEDEPGIYKCICKINWAKFLTQRRLYIFNNYSYMFKNPDTGSENRAKLNEYINFLKSYKDDTITFVRIPERCADIFDWWGSDPQFKLPGEKIPGAIPVFKTEDEYYITLNQILWEIFVEQIEPSYGHEDCLLIKNSRKK